MKTPPDLVIHVHTRQYSRLHQACALTATAAALGKVVHMAFYMEALGALVRGELATPGLAAANDAPSEAEVLSGMERVGAPSAADLLRKAREIGDVEVWACTASMQFLRLAPSQVEPHVTRMGGLAAILEATLGAPTTLTF